MSPEDFADSIAAKVRNLEAAMADGRTEFARLRSEFDGMRGEVRDLKDMVHRLGQLSTQLALNTQRLEQLDGDMGEIRDEFRSRTDKLQTAVELARDETRAIDASRLKERKEDRKWLVITSIMSAGLIISAMGLFFGLQ